MSLKNSPLFHFVVGTLWFVTAVITAFEIQTFIGSVYWPPILYGASGVCFYVRGFYLIIKNRQNSTNNN